MNIKTLLFGALCGACLSSTAWAVPPTQVRGVDLAAVLVVNDRARQVDHSQKAQVGEPLKGLRTIVLDPGHGGENQGALGVCDVHEKFLTLELAYELRDQLQRKHPEARIILTRYWDQNLGLSERMELANQVEADLFISLHYNAASHPRALGFETYFLLANETIPGQEEVRGEPIASSGSVTGVETKISPDVEIDPIEFMQEDLRRQTQNADSGLLAEVVNSSLQRHLSSVNRGVKQANFGVLRDATMPAVVMEAGFVSHPHEGAEVVKTSHRQALVQALYEAILEFDEKIAEKNGR